MFVSEVVHLMATEDGPAQEDVEGQDVYTVIDSPVACGLGFLMVIWLSVLVN